MPTQCGTGKGLRRLVGPKNLNLHSSPMLLFASQLTLPPKCPKIPQSEMKSKNPNKKSTGRGRHLYLSSDGPPNAKRARADSPICLDPEHEAEHSWILGKNSDYLSEVLGCSDASNDSVLVSPCSHESVQTKKITNFCPTPERPPRPEHSKRESRTDPKRSSSSSGSYSSDDEGSLSGKPAAKPIKKAKEPLNPPRHPLSAYVHFYKAVRDRNAAAVQKRKSRYLNIDALSETVDAQWKRLSDAERKVYEDLARDDRKKYERELAEYEKKKAELVPPRPPPKKEEDGPSSRTASQDLVNLSSSLGIIPLQQLFAADTPPNQRTAPAGPRASITPLVHSINQLPNGVLREGMELQLPDRQGIPRKYRVRYVCLPMRRNEAREFLHHWTNLANHHQQPPAPTHPVFGNFSSH